MRKLIYTIPLFYVHVQLAHLISKINRLLIKNYSVYVNLGKMQLDLNKTFNNFLGH